MSKAGGSAAGSLKPTHKPSTSTSSYLLITRRPSVSSSARTQSTPTRRLERPYPLIALNLVDLTLTFFYAVGAQRIIGVLRFCVISIFVGSSKGWRARSGSIMIACVGSILSVLWEACNAAMAGQSGWKSPAAMTVSVGDPLRAGLMSAQTAAFSVLEYVGSERGDWVELTTFPPLVDIRIRPASISSCVRIRTFPSDKVRDAHYPYAKNSQSARRFRQRRAARRRRRRRVIDLFF